MFAYARSTTWVFPCPQWYVLGKTVFHDVCGVPMRGPPLGYFHVLGCRVIHTDLGLGERCDTNYDLICTAKHVCVCDLEMMTSDN
jgi:hypothetical protein